MKSLPGPHLSRARKRVVLVSDGVETGAESVDGPVVGADTDTASGAGSDAGTGCDSSLASSAGAGSFASPTTASTSSSEIAISSGFPSSGFPSSSEIAISSGLGAGFVGDGGTSKSSSEIAISSGFPTGAASPFSPELNSDAHSGAAASSSLTGGTAPPPGLCSYMAANLTCKCAANQYSGCSLFRSSNSGGEPSVFFSTCCQLVSCFEAHLAAEEGFAVEEGAGVAVVRDTDRPVVAEEDGGFVQGEVRELRHVVLPDMVDAAQFRVVVGHLFEVAWGQRLSLSPLNRTAQLPPT